MGNQCVGAGGPHKQENLYIQVGHGKGQGQGQRHGHGQARGRPEVRIAAIKPITTAPVETFSQGSVGVEAMSPVMSPSLRSAERAAPAVVTTSGSVQEEEPAIVSQTAASTSTLVSTREIYTRGPIELKETSVNTASASLPSEVVTPVSTHASTGGKIEVCTGGKCKKGGSLQILASLQKSFPESSNISVTPCKCLKNCKAAPNVRVTNSEGQMQVHSHVSVDNVDTLREWHFRVQCCGNQGNATPVLFASIDAGVAVAT